jgi:hypothetical protein
MSSNGSSGSGSAGEAAWSLLGAAAADMFDIEPPRTTEELEGLVDRLFTSNRFHFDATPQSE